VDTNSSKIQEKMFEFRLHPLLQRIKYPRSVCSTKKGENTKLCCSWRWWKRE